MNMDFAAIEINKADKENMIRILTKKQASVHIEAFIAESPNALELRIILRDWKDKKDASYLLMQTQKA